MRMTVGEIAEACEGRLLCGDWDAVVTSVSTDSRKISEGTLFVPLRGARVDAHSYIGATFAAGAVATLTQNHTEMEDAHAFIAVEDTQRALQQIAAAYRRRFSIPIVGVTGSVGKTTTKEMVALALSAGRHVMKTEGNYNSAVGLPLTLFQLEPEHTAAVVEMGMSDFGEMSVLARIAAPQYAVVTNIGVSHIQQLKTQENIQAEKLHIADCFTPESVLFLNGDDPFLSELRQTSVPYRRVYYGTAPWCDYRAEEISFTPERAAFSMDVGAGRRRISLPASGMHNVLNALAALAVADVLDVGIGPAAEALEAYKPLAMRQQIHRVNGIVLIDDTYNASPDSMRSSLSMLCSMRKPGGRCIAILADMLELGELERAAHLDVGRRAAEAGVDILVTAGSRAAFYAQGAREVQPELACRICEDNAEAIDAVRELITQDDTVLVKGSRSMKTDEIVRALL